MEVIDPEKNTQPTQGKPGPEKRRFVLTGLFLLGFGAVLLFDRTGNAVPEWFISWETILIAVGIYIGEKHRFSNPTFLIPIGIGVVFLINDIYPDLAFRNYIAPGILICIGLIFIFRPRKVWNWRDHSHGGMRNRHVEQYYENEAKKSELKDEEFVDSVSIFGSTKKNIMSKNFKGGEAINFFGGTELNLMQADIQGPIELELVQVFGGCKLILPPHWEIKSEIVNIFGGMEDKRPTYNVTPDPSKVVHLRGTSIFGGIEIRSY